MTYRPPRHKLISLCCAAVFVMGCEELAPTAAQGPAPVERAKEGPRGPAKTKRATPAVDELKAKDNAQPLRPSCPQGLVARNGAPILAEHLREISGIVASRKSPGLLWVHNDSGDEGRIYGLESNSVLLGTIDLSAPAYDFEDIALEGRNGAPDRIYVADTGDNLAERKDGVFIHRFEEPTRNALRKKGGSPPKVAAVQTMRLRFPEGPRDAEALLVDPSSGELVLITKPHLAPPEIYEISAFSAEGMLTRKGVITKQTSGYDLHMVTAADMSADGRWILVRSYTDILAFPRTSDESISSALLGKACRIEPSYEPQGEAIAFLPPSENDARRAPFPEFVTVGEGIDQPLQFYGFIKQKAGSSPPSSRP